MGMLDGKVALITGAGRGVGREEALIMAKEGCNLIINDIGGGASHLDKDAKIADTVVEEVKKLGVKAIANYDSVVDFNKTKGMIDQAIAEFGKIDIIVNNAGILRDRMIFNMTEEEFDLVIAVHLKGTFNLTRHGAAYFRESGKADESLGNFGRIINTASDSGLYGNVGQSNYGAAKSAIATFTLIISRELAKYATVNCVVPSARTRMTTDLTPRMGDYMKAKTPDGFDIFNPSHFAPLVAYLASPAAKGINGEVFRAIADKVWVYRGWRAVKKISNNWQPFTPQLLADRFPELMKDLPSKSEGAAGGDELMKS
ncbi:MAG: SDR family NAD(P)-dependent oxidoreductase [Candidatus Lokiarchaeota archaeon]|nr:SDR family NAD(P)-dependent oxidoreductase [Candidatus Lokiarchaeota archaeon]